MRKAFNFYRSYYEAANNLPHEAKVEFYLALIEYQFTKKEPTFTTVAQYVWLGCKHQIDMQVKGYEDKIKSMTPTPQVLPIWTPTTPTDGGAITPYEPPCQPPADGGSNTPYEPPCQQEKEKGKEEGKVKEKEKDSSNTLLEKEKYKKENSSDLPPKQNPYTRELVLKTFKYPEDEHVAWAKSLKSYEPIKQLYPKSLSGIDAERHWAKLDDEERTNAINGIKDFLKGRNEIDTPRAIIYLSDRLWVGIDDFIAAEGVKIASDVYLKISSHLSLTYQELLALMKCGYKRSEIDEVADELKNYGRNKNYKSAYLTMKNWLKKRRTESPPSGMITAEYALNEYKQRAEKIEKEWTDEDY
jgi:hypothetical protein